MTRITRQLSQMLYKLISNEGIYFAFAFIVYGFPVIRPLMHMPGIGTIELYRAAYRDLFRIIAWGWGMILCAMRVERNRHCAQWESRLDLSVLFVLVLWISVPFLLRFGVTGNVVLPAYNSILVFFAIYASYSEREGGSREKILDWTCAIFACGSAILAGAALYCAVTVQNFEGFGVIDHQQLCMGMHHNSSGILAICCALMCLFGAARKKQMAVRILYLVPSVMMMLVVVLTQSRTSRYCLLASLALGVYGMIAGNRRCKNVLVRHGVALVLGAAVIVSGYNVSSVLTDEALEHYAYTTANVKRGISWAPKALAGGEVDQESVVVAQARGAGDLSFTGRTMIWEKVLQMWEENPRHMLIGFGAGNTENEIGQEFLHEEDSLLTAHNSYLQYITDYGLIGFALMAAFLCLMVKPCLRVFFADNQLLMPGSRVLCMMFVTALLEGFMESETFNAISPMNMILFIALGLIFSYDRDLRKIKQA